MLAEKLGIVDVSLSRKLRYEMPESEKQRVLQAIEELNNNK